MSIEDNVAASQAACTVMSLAMSEATNHTNEAALRFWTTILKSVLQIVPEHLRPKQIVQAPVVPMTRSESAKFEMTRIEFGKHTGDFIDEVPLEYLEWLDSQPDFRMQLRRYLASERVQQLMVVSDEEDV